MKKTFSQKSRKNTMFVVGGIVAVIVVAGIMLGPSGGIFNFGVATQTQQTASQETAAPAEESPAAESATVTETVAATATPPAVRSISIEGDDSAFYLDGSEVTQVAASQGETVVLKIKTRTTNVGFGGLQYKSADFGGIDTGMVAPGSEKEVQITADAAGKIMSYWPSTDRLKATLNIVIA